MGFNKKVLSQIKSDLNSAKPPARKKDIIVDPAGQWKYPGQNTRIPSSNITMQGVPYPVYAQPNVGQPQMMYPGQEYTFPGADYVDEYPQMKKGGQKKYSRSLEAKNRLFVDSPLVKKKKKKNKKIFNPFAKYYQDGGESKAEKILGPIPLNSGRKTLRDWTYGQSIGMLQEQDGGEADYIEVDLTPEEIEEYKKGGYIVKDISVPSLTRFTEGGANDKEKKKKKKKKEVSTEGFAFDSNTQLYKFGDDGSRAYAKGGDGKWYEYTTYNAGFNEEGDRIVKGYFTEIDPSYDVEKNLVPNLTSMTDEEKRTIKMGVTNLPTVKLTEKVGPIRKLVDKIQKNYWEDKLTDEEKQAARDMYNTSYYNNLDISGSNLRGVGDWLTYKFSDDDEWTKYVEEQNKLPKERIYPSIWDAYGEVYTQRKRKEQREKQAQKSKNINTQTEEYQRYQAEKNYRELMSKPQSAQAADWLWQAGVLGGAGIGTGAVGDLVAATSNAAGTLVSALEAEALPGVTYSNLFQGYTYGNLGNDYIVDPLVTGELNKSGTDIVKDLITTLGPINRYTNALSTAATVEKGVNRGLQKNFNPETGDDLYTAFGTFKGLSKLPSLYKQQGGAIEAELTPAEIEEYRRQGYIVEEY